MHTLVEIILAPFAVVLILAVVAGIFYAIANWL